MSWSNTCTYTTAALLLSLALLCGCGDNMRGEARFKPLEPGGFFSDGRSSRPLVNNTIARGMLREDQRRYSGLEDGEPVREFPLPLSRELLERGRERFNIFCSPCHGRDGYGQGMIVQRGFALPPSYHSERLQAEPVGHFFLTMTNGRGAMFSYAERIPSHQDRWAIVAYIRALQLSQHAALEDVPPEQRDLLEEPAP